MKSYLETITAVVNRKGVLDVDTVKGCACGMAKYPDGGCYGLCYANKTAKLYGMKFNESITRKRMTIAELARLKRTVMAHEAKWFRIGNMGDPCHNWDLTIDVCRLLARQKTPVIVTKHWISLPDQYWAELVRLRVVINTSVSALDTFEELDYRVNQFTRMKAAGIRSVLRIVSCRFGNTDWGRARRKAQEWLFGFSSVIDNPLRIPKADDRVKAGHIIVERRKDLGGGSFVSVARPDAYIGTCLECPDQCGLSFFKDKEG